MTTITLQREVGWTGSIYDIESDQYDITIDMGERGLYAVGGPSYYNLGWTCHETAEDALDQYAQHIADGYQGIVILDRDGDEVDIESMRREHDYYGPED